MRKKEFMLFLTIVLLSLSSFSYAQEYYADLTIDVQEDGLVKITGITNDPSLSPGTYQAFSSKKGIYWLLNISSKEAFSDYILAVTLPDGAEFNYLKTSGRSRISYDDGIKIIASGTDSLSLVVQYSITKKANPFIIFLLLFFAFIVMAVIAGVYLKKSKFTKFKLEKGDNEKSFNSAKSHKSASLKDKEENETNKEAESDENKKETEKLSLLKKTLAEAQVKIIDLLLEEGGSLTQKQLQHRSGFPKATLSRNVDVLVKKNIIIKQSRGMTNMISINKELLK